MVAEAEFLCHPTIAFQCLRGPPPNIQPDSFDMSQPDIAARLSVNLSRRESALSCSTSLQISRASETVTRKFVPKIRSGSYTDIGPRSSNEDEHIRIDDLCTHLGSLYSWSEPSSFYAVFDGHGGPGAAAFMKNNTMKIFFEDAKLPQRFDVDESFLQALEKCHRRSYLQADQALADELIADSYSGTTALTVLVLGRNLLVANAGDCRAVLCRKGDAIQLSQDHRPCCPLEKKRVEDLGGTIEYGYLNGELAVTRALGDWYMKLPVGSASPLTAEPEIQFTMLTEDDEFLIVACDGIWDVMSNHEAVSLVQKELSYHNDPHQCARELTNQALMRDTGDNVTAIVVCFSSSSSSDELPDNVYCERPRLRLCISENARAKLRKYVQGN